MTATAALPQHLQALGRANEIRFARADFRRELAAAGTLAARDRLIELLRSDDTPPWLASAPVGVVIDYIPRYGRQRMLRTLATAKWNLGRGSRLSETRRFDSLTERQRAALADALGAGR